MKRAHRIVQTLTCICGLAIGLGLPDATLPRALAVETPMGTSFVYQGELRSGPSVVSTTDLKFRLYTAAIGGTQIGSELGVTGLNLVRGRFSVELDFGPGTFAGNERWIEIDVRSPAGSGSYSTLAARQKVDGASLRRLRLNGNPGPSGATGGHATTAQQRDGAAT